MMLRAFEHAGFVFKLIIPNTDMQKLLDPCVVGAQIWSRFAFVTRVQ